MKKLWKTEEKDRCEEQYAEGAQDKSGWRTYIRFSDHLGEKEVLTGFKIFLWQYKLSRSLHSHEESQVKFLHLLVATFFKKDGLRNAESSKEGAFPYFKLL